MLALAAILPCAIATGDVTLRTDHVDLVIDDDGCWRSFVDRASGQELLADGGRQPIMWVGLPAGEFAASAARLQGDQLTVQFGEDVAEAVLQVVQHPSHIAFELISVTPGSALEVQLAALLLKPLKYGASIVNCVYDDRFAAGVLALNLPVNCRLEGQNTAGATLDGVTQALTLAEGDAPSGRSFGEYTAVSTRETGDGWAVRHRTLRATLDLSDFAGLGLWVRGDGLGELLKVQLFDAQSEGLSAYKDHYVKVDFTGWKYVELPRAPEDAINYRHIASVNLYYNGLPAKTTVVCGLDDLRAIRTLTGEPSTDPADLVIEDFESPSCPYLDRQGIQLSASCHAKYGMVGARFGVYGCPRPQFATVMQQIERTEGLPSPQLSGRWGRLSPDVKRSYIMFHDLSEANVDRAIQYAKLANVGMIVLLESCWASSAGHFPINERNYPDGIESLKRTVRKIHAAGLRSGLHFLACGITENDAYISPIPDSRLLKDSSVTLAADLDAETTTVLCDEEPGGRFPREDRGYEGNGVDVQVDEEIIRYGGIEGTRLVLCRRGAYGTTAAPHKAGAKVGHLRRHYGMFLRDVDSSINDEVADRIAYIVNECGFGMTYWDGSEALQDDHWYYNPKLQYEFANRYKNRDAMLMQGSSYNHLSWHLHPRQASADGYRDIKQLLDERSPAFETWYKTNFMPVDIGWYGIGQERLTFDDIEYVLCRSIGYDSSLGWSTPVAALDSYPRTRELLELCGRYERLRLAGVFDEATRARLREPKRDYRLARDGDAWRFVDAQYDPPVTITTTAADANTWTLPPPLVDAAGLEVEIRVGEALRPGANWDRADNVVLEDFATLAPYAEEGNDYEKFVIGPGKLGGVREGVTQKLELTAESSPAGGPSATYEAVSTLADNGGWSAVGKRFAQPLDISWMAGLGIWVHGDGKGAAFKVQLRDAAGDWNDHYIALNYTGWRYHELVEPQSGNLDRRRVAYLLFYFNGLPASQTSAVYIGPLKALRELSPPVRDLRLTLGERAVTFPGEFDTGQTILYRGLRNTELLTWGKGRTAIKAEGREFIFADGETPARLDVNGVLTRSITVRTARVGR